MKLHGGPLSPFVRKVAVCLIEKGAIDQVVLERSETAMAKPNQKLMKDNPLSKIPTFVTDDGVPLFDSDVICEYIDVTFPPPRLVPLDGPRRWECLTRVALANGVLDALVYWRFERNRPVPQQSTELLAAMEIKVVSSLQKVEALIADARAEEIDLFTITAGVMLGYLDFRFEDMDWRKFMPASFQWFVGFSQRPSARMTEPYAFRPDARQDPHLQHRLQWQ